MTLCSLTSDTSTPVGVELCTLVAMSRTNIDIDDELVTMAMSLYNLRTKREAVNYALRQLVGDPMSLEEALAMEGVGWEGDLDQIKGGGHIQHLDDVNLDHIKDLVFDDSDDSDEPAQPEPDQPRRAG